MVLARREVHTWKAPLFLSHALDERHRDHTCGQCEFCRAPNARDFRFASHVAALESFERLHAFETPVGEHISCWARLKGDLILLWVYCLGHEPVMSVQVSVKKPSSQLVMFIDMITVIFDDDFSRETWLKPPGIDNQSPIHRFFRHQERHCHW